MTSLAEAFGLGRGCFGREGVLRGTGTFPESHRSELVRECGLLLYALHRTGSQGRGGLWVIKYL